MTPFPHRFAVASLVLTLLSACASSREEDSSTRSSPQPLQQLVVQSKVCGAAVAVIRQHALRSVTTASGCPGWATPSPDSLFQAASLGKPLFAYAVLKLAREGVLDLDAPVMRYLPHGYRHAFDPLRPDRDGKTDDVADPRLEAVTIRMLLQHTAGLPNWSSGPLRFEGTPGLRWSYSGEGYVLLQRAVEAIMSQPLEAIMRDRVFRPLGMTRSSFAWTPSVQEALIPGAKVNGAPREAWPLKQGVAAFSLYTSAEDYAHFVLAVLTDRELLQTIELAPIDVDADLNLAWGLGWGIERTSSGRYLWQWGNNPGYRAFVMLRPAAGDAVILLSSGEGGLSIAEPVVQNALPDEHCVFQWSMLQPDGLDLMCRYVRLCL